LDVDGFDTGLEQHLFAVRVGVLIITPWGSIMRLFGNHPMIKKPY
jgi:hypothetical protein